MIVRRAATPSPFPAAGRSSSASARWSWASSTSRPTRLPMAGCASIPERAVADGLQMVEDGADILDVGGESTRPGAEPLPESEELRRVLPVVERLLATGAGARVDRHLQGALPAQAVARGAAIVNDVSALQFDEGLAGAVAETGAALVVMHNRGRSRDMYGQAAYRRRWRLKSSSELQSAIDRADERRRVARGDHRGSRTRLRQDVRSIPTRPSRDLDRLRSLDRPMLSGPSRKSFLKQRSERVPPTSASGARRRRSPPACCSAPTSSASTAFGRWWMSCASPTASPAPCDKLA